MPFCQECARYWAPTAMTTEGACPQCLRTLDNEPRTASLKVDIKHLASSGGDDDVSAPWHFKLLVTGLVVYLGWRVIALFI